jgi:hypothetical protein
VLEQTPFTSIEAKLFGNISLPIGRADSIPVSATDGARVIKEPEAIKFWWPDYLKQQLDKIGIICEDEIKGMAGGADPNIAFETFKKTISLAKLLKDFDENGLTFGYHIVSTFYQPSSRDPIVSIKRFLGEEKIRRMARGLGESHVIPYVGFYLKGCGETSELKAFYRVETLSVILEVRITDEMSYQSSPAYFVKGRYIGKQKGIMCVPRIINKIRESSGRIAKYLDSL